MTSFVTKDRSSSGRLGARALTRWLGILLLGAATAWAAPVAELKSDGLVGEQSDGYLGAVNGSADVAAQVEEINQRRRAEYQRIAKSRQISLADVEALAGQKLTANAAPGEWIRVANGDWRRR